jgi:HEPN domain-containing protein
MPERSGDWMAQAERDLEQAEWSLKGGFYEWVCFTCQQAAEKAVKAVFQARHGVA